MTTVPLLSSGAHVETWAGPHLISQETRIIMLLTTHKNRSRTHCLLAVCAGLFVLASASALSQDPAPATDPVLESQTQTASQDAPITPGADEPSPEKTASEHPYGWFALAPAAIAIILTLLTRQVVPALVVGVIAGAFMLLPSPDTAGGFGAWTITGFQNAAEKYTMGAILDPRYGYGHLKIIIFTLTIGFMVGVMGRSGGTAGMVERVAGLG